MRKKQDNIWPKGIKTVPLQNLKMTNCKQTSKSCRHAHGLAYRLAVRTAVLVSLLMLAVSVTRAATTEEQTTAVHEDDDRQELAAIDSLERAGKLSPAMANSQRAAWYQDHSQLRTAVMYYKRALATDELMRPDAVNYYQTLYNLVIALDNSNNLDDAITYATRGYNRARKDTTATVQDCANQLLAQVGCCQLKLGRSFEADKTFQQARQQAEQLADRHEQSPYFATTCFEVASMIANQYLNTFKYNYALPWVTMMDQWLHRLRKTSTDRELLERYAAQVDIDRAIILNRTGQRDQAEKVYRRFLDSDYASSYGGIYDQAYYLEVTEQWQALLNMLPAIDAVEQQEQTSPTLDYLLSTPSTAFKALMKTGHREAALKKAEEIIGLLDTVRSNQQRSDAAELAVIFETQEKDAQIARQQADMTRQQLVASMVIFVVVVLGLAVFIFFRQRAAKRLGVAHQQLRTAYDQLEETTTAKERIESELRIARDIQMSMVPRVFPDAAHDHLDLYASMTPAKEVGGDLYGYVMLGEKLYFCVGDVSGKGVPASLFMAQATRLFRTLAVQGMMPAEIAMRMNDALSVDNEAGMFVTMFIGMANLTTGHLDFCNAGHNPPVIGASPTPSESGSSTLEKPGGAYFLEMIPNAPIGIIPELEYVGEEIDNIKDTPLFIYTDGLNEAENRQQEQLGDDRLLELLQQVADKDSRQVVETLQQAVERHRDGAEPNDDLTMMCLKIY
jgi:serine phosphatase RsbU (regulator of sigma subunit)